MSEDWLNDAPAQLPAPAALPVEPRARLALLEECFSRLTKIQREWLLAFQHNRLNVRRTARALGRDHGKSTSHRNWMREPDYSTVVRIWQAEAGQEALDRDRLLARQDDIVETLLTPKPVLHEGIAVFDPRRPGENAILEEVEAGAASRANEVLMKAAGLLKDKELEVNIGLVGPALNIQVMQPDGGVKDVTPRGVEIALPEPEEDWLA